MATAGYRKERSAGGFKLSVLKSGLQKAVRRGDVQLALQFAKEFQSFKNAEGKPMDRQRIRTNFLHRLMIIFLEDVGQEYLWPIMEKYRKQAFATEWPSDSAIYPWVACMARAPKSRACSHARAVAQSGNSPITEKHPDVFKFYRESGVMDESQSLVKRFYKSMQRQSDQAFVLAWHLSQSKEKIKTTLGSKPEWFIHVQIAQTCKTSAQRKLSDLAVKWNKELVNVKEGFLCWMLLLLSRVWNLPAGPVPSDDIIDIPPLTVIPEYVMDMHVTGKKDYVRFAEEGSHVENEDGKRVNQAFKAFYNDLKRVQAGLQPIGAETAGENSKPSSSSKRKADAISSSSSGSLVPSLVPSLVSSLVPSTAPLETRTFPDALRTQINTGRSKTDVYISTNATGTMKVIKGPFKNVSSITQAVALDKWKAANGMASTGASLVWLIPDRWPDGVPLGIRNSLDQKKPAPFLVSNCLIPGSMADIPVKEHGSKLWPPTRVVDWSKLPEYYWNPTNKENTDQEKQDYVVALLYRYIYGLGDLADRNFFKSKGRLVSIDEDCAPREVYLGTELKKTRAFLAKTWASDYAQNIIAIVKGWSFDKQSVEYKRWSNALNFAASARACFDLFAC